MSCWDESSLSSNIMAEARRSGRVDMKEDAVLSDGDVARLI